MAQNYDAYKDIISKEMTKSWVALGVISLLCIAVLVFFIYDKIDSSKEEKKAKHPSKRKKKSMKREKIEWYGSVIVLCAIFLGSAICFGTHISNCLHDLHNEDFVVYDGGFSVVANMTWGSPSSTTYEAVFAYENKEVRVTVNEDDFHLAEGDYTDMVLVYSSRSKMAVDMWEIPE